jgi:rubredoxin
MMVKCAQCNGSKKIVDRSTSEWNRRWDYYDNQGQYDMDTCSRKADEEVGVYINCPSCNKELDNN